MPGREGFPPCQIRRAGSCQPLSAGLRSTDESLQVSQAPPHPTPWPASWVARGSESTSQGGSWDGDWAQQVGERQCPSGLAEPSPSEGSPVPTWTSSGRSGHAPLPRASRLILLAAQMRLGVMRPGGSPLPPPRDPWGRGLAGSGLRSLRLPWCLLAGLPCSLGEKLPEL